MVIKRGDYKIYNPFKIPIKKRSTNGANMINGANLTNGANMTNGANEAAGSHYLKPAN